MKIKFGIFEGKGRGNLTQLFEEMSKARHEGMPFVREIPFSIHGNAPDYYIAYSSETLNDEVLKQVWNAMNEQIDEQHYDDYWL